MNVISEHILHHKLKTKMILAKMIEIRVHYNSFGYRFNFKQTYFLAFEQHTSSYMKVDKVRTLDIALFVSHHLRSAQL